jgi:hypothetical protein
MMDKAMIEKVAHELWVKRGSPKNGDPMIDWAQAEKIVAQQQQGGGKPRTVGATIPNGKKARSSTRA